MTQATVRSWEPGAGGAVLLDDGSELALPSDCLEGSVFRFLRVGQRIALELADGVVTGVDLP